METKTKTTRIEPLLFLYDTHTKLFTNAIEGISDKDSQSRLGTKANHPSWLAGSLVQQRFDNANLLGSDMKQAADELFKDFKGIQDKITYPSLVSYKADWEKISPVLRNLMENITDEKLDSIYEYPDMSMPHFDLIAWSVHREAYIIGQLGLWRRLLGYEPMKFM